MKIYTSYFAKAEALKKLNIVPISIALYSPKFFNGPSIGFLAPKRHMLSEGLPTGEYTRMYNEEILAKIDMDLFRIAIKNISGGKDVALLCYEKPGDFCHRRLFAEWVKDKFNYDIEEYNFNTAKEEKPEKQKAVQPKLFE